jgi:hypothetical protein
MSTIVRKYAHIYLAISPATKAPIMAPPPDDRALAWTDFADAQSAADRIGYIVVNWQWFSARVLRTLTGSHRPTGLRIAARIGKEVTHHHAELDATEDELRTLNHLTPAGIARAPSRIAAQMKSAKVWRE